MAPRKPKAGDEYVYVGSAPLGIDNGALLPGTTVTVREYVDAGEPGAHDDEEDAIVVEWDAPGTVITDMVEEDYSRPEPRIDAATGELVLDDDNNPIIDLVPRKRAVPILGYGTIRRAMSIGVNGRDYTDAAGRPATFPPFADLFTEA